MKRKFSWALALLLLVTAASSTLAYEASKYLNIPDVKQDQTKWCYAGASLSVLNYYGIYTSQCQFVTYVKTGQTSPQNCPNDGATVQEAQQGLSYFGVSSAYYSGALSFSLTKSEITYDRPVYVSIVWLDPVTNKEISGHAVVIDGYYEWTNVGYQEVTFMDPWDGVHKSMEYNSFVYTAYDHRWRWGLKSIQEI